MTTTEVFSSSRSRNLIAAYAAECSIDLIGPIDPQPDMYEAMEKAGILRCFGVLDEKELVGFATVLISKLPHYGKRIATMESLFVGGPYRKLGAGTELLRAVEDYARARGCTVLFYSAPAGSQLERLLAAKKAIVRTNTIFCKAV